jgi:putative two-component system response regulator
MSSAHTEALEALLQTTRSASDPDFKGVLTRLSSELHDRLGRGTSASINEFTRAFEALARIKGPTHAELRMSCICDCVHFFFLDGRVPLALRASRHLAALAHQVNSKSWLRKAHNMKGILHADIGDVGEALVDYSKALDIATDAKDRDGEVVVLLNIGVALNYSGLYREAIPCLQRAADVASSDPALEKHRGAALTNIAQSYWFLDEPNLGFDAISLSISLAKEPTDAMSAHLRTVREFTFVQLALEVGKLALARAHSEACTKYGHWGSTQRSVGLSAIAGALCEIHGGDVDKGLSLLESVLSTCGDIGSIRAAALIALVKAYDEVGRPEQALMHMRSLLQYIRGVREKTFLTLLRVQAAWTPQHSVEESRDLRAFESVEARLRAEVSERELANSRIEMLERLAVTADLRDDFTGEHGYRVGKLSALLASVLGWAKDPCNAIDIAARLHDLGKIGVPDRILLNTSELQVAERHFVSAHTVIGAELLSKSNIPQLRIAEEIARHHHEWWDGTGYPSKLSGKRIPIHARIVALADVFDALTHGRPFSPPWPMERAIEEIRNRRGTQFDPELTDIFLDLIEKLRAEHSDLDAYLGKAGKNSPFLQARNKIRLMLADERENERKATVAGNETRH